jgi:hypothetical protein
MPRAAPSLYALDPAMPVLLRPDGAVQVGWDPRRAVLVRPPNGLAAAALAALLRSMRSPIPITELQRQAADRGLKDADGLTNLVAQLVGAGVATRACRQSGGRAASIRVHGRGPLSDLLVEALRCSGARIAHSSQQPCHPPPWIWWCWRTTWSRIRAWCAICIARASRTLRFGCATAPVWWGRWSSPPDQLPG